MAVRIALPSNIYRYVWEASGWHQLPLVVLTVLVSLLEVVPLELQRRIVDDAVKNRDYGFVILLCGVYVGAVLFQGGTKLVLNIYRNWVGESAVRELRRRVHALVDATSAASSTLEAEGVQASMIVSEVEPVGSFVGGSVSEPLLQAGVLCAVLAYMIHVDVRMAAVALLFFVPQLIFVPIMQRAMNRRTHVRVRIIRRLSISVIEGGGDPARDAADDARIDRVFRLNMGIYKLKFSMNFLMNLSTQLQIIGALAVGAWAVLHDQLEIGGVVAFISGIGRITDPWGDLVNYFRDANVNQVKFGLLRDAISQQGFGSD
ncbi:MAG TPA: ABC transporter transmembrane domain-containing protein [Stellaceae bacterium]|nr:ABC transporter transmembrane domain-containing protein [Stellaceae bacterium]